MRGHDTPEGCRAWFDGECTRFDDLDEWLEKNPAHNVLRDRQDARGFDLVALKDDLVHFKLRCADHLVTLMASRVP